MNKRCLKRENENNLEYRSRLYRNKNIYGLNNKEIYELYIKETNDTLAESSVRCSAIQYNLGFDAGIREDNEKFDKSVMVINDVHLPFERDDVLELISKHSNEITHLVIAGDLIDCEAVSSFPKIERGTMLDELLYAYEFINKVRKILNNNQKIIIIKGNHCDRFTSTIKKMQEKNLQMFINPEILSMISDGFTIYKDSKKMVYKPVENVTYIPHWYAQIDNLIVAHPKDFSRVKGKMLENVCSYFINQNLQFDMVIFGHTHKYSCGVVDRFANKFIVENPCLCKPQEYSDCGKLGFSPQAYGYTVINYNNEEKIDPNNVKTYILSEKYDNKSCYKINL